MKFTCSTKDIAAAIGAASKIVNPHTTVPILANVLMTAEGGAVRVRATDLEITMEQSFAAEVQQEGSVTVPARLVAGYFSNMAAGLVSVEGTDHRASVRFERSNCDFHALPAGEYPPPPVAQKGASFSLPAALLREAVGATVFAASSEEARGAVLMGTLVQVEGDRISLVATDGYRLALWSGALDRPAEHPEKFIVPSRALTEVARNMGGNEPVEVSVMGANGNQLRFSCGATSIMVRLVDGQYPNYGQIIPARFDRAAVVNTQAFVGALRRAEMVSGDRASMVKVALADGLLVITAKSDVTGNAHEEIPVEQTGDDIETAFNARYLTEILSHVDAPQTMLEFVGPLSPASVKPLDDSPESRRFCLLMPLRT